ncbi:MAG: GxxExxY protein, partial [Chloroflexi bacterium]|nr:GxxExxY protein [Chloroflexota bacterium]
LQTVYGLAIEQKMRVPIIYRGRQIGQRTLDLVVRPNPAREFAVRYVWGPVTNGAVRQLQLDLFFAGLPFGLLLSYCYADMGLSITGYDVGAWSTGAPLLLDVVPD